MAESPGPSPSLRASTPWSSGPSPGRRRRAPAGAAGSTAANLHRVAGAQLPELPSLLERHGGRADEAAQARPVGPEHDRHVPRVVDRADRVGRVVDVGGMQPGLASVGASPLRGRPEEPDPGAGRVEVDLPGGRVERLDGPRGEELGRGVGALDDLDLPLVRELRPGRGRAGRGRLGGDADRQHVAGPQRPAAVSAEAAEGEGGRAAVVFRHVDPARDRDVDAQAGATGLAHVQHAAGGDRHGLPLRHRAGVHGHGHRRAAYAHGRGPRAPQCGSVEEALEARQPRLVPHGEVGAGKRPVVHRAGGRHAHAPQPETPWKVLHGGLVPRPHDLDARRVVHELGERGRRVGDVAERGGAEGCAHETEVRLDAVEAGLVEGVEEPVERGPSIHTGDDHLRQQRVVRRGDLGSGGDPAVHARAGRGLHQCHEPGARVAGGVLGVDPGLNRVPPRGGRRKLEHVRVTERQAEHPIHQVDPERLLGDRVLDLEARVELDEVGLLALGVVDVLDRAGGAVARGGRERARPFGDAPADRVGQRRSGRLLDHLLMPALVAAVAVAEDGDAPAAVAEDLHLHVACSRHEGLEIDRRASEGARSVLHSRPSLAQLPRRRAGRETQPAASTHGLQHQRVAELRARLQGGVERR